MKKPLHATANKHFSVLPPPLFFNIILVFLLLNGFFNSSMAQQPAQFVTGTSYIGGYHIKCNGQNTGSLHANPTFGTAPYSFLWNTGDTAQKLMNKPAGIYIVTATDVNHVARTDTFELRQPYALNHQSTVSDFYGYQIEAYGGSRGYIQLSATGGTPPYRYLWSNGDSAANRGNLSAGSYSFTITDANQCTYSSSITLTAPNPIQVSFSNTVNPLCNKSTDGAASINISGGLGDFSVVWDNGSFSMSPDNLHSGFNAVRIYERGNAVLDTGITLTAPDAIDIQFTYSNYNGFNVSCVDCFNGTVNTTVTGGTAPYTYQWEDANNSTTANLSNLNGGEYFLKVLDAHGCKMGNTAQLSMPTPKDWSRYGNANIDTAQFIGSTDTSAVVFKTNSQEALRLMGNGNVGVGTATPTEKLDVNGTIKAQGFKLDNLSFKFQAASGLIPEKITWGAEDNAPWAAVGAPVMPSSCIDPLNIYRYNVFTGGAVFKTKANQLCSNAEPSFYVGLLGCDAALEVVQDGTTLNNGPSSNLNKLLLNTLCGRDVLVGRSDGGNLVVNHNLGIGVVAPAEKLEVNGNGKISGTVGIGNVIPEAALHIKNGLANSLIIENTQSPNILRLEASNGVSRMISNGSIAFFFNSNQQNSNSEFSVQKNASSWNGSNVELFKIYNNGNSYFKESLSIGTNSFHPDFKLQVCGGIKAKRVRVEESWCDYVFDDNYQLLPLNEVEKYYKMYRHLPDIPPSSEIEINGLDLGQLVALQMKKIEELTIHMVEMQKEILKLKNELAK